MWFREMACEYMLISLGYLCLAVVVAVIEARRTKHSGPDLISIFMLLFVLQCCASGVVIFGLLPYVNPLTATGVFPFDRILHSISAVTAGLVFSLTVAFAMFFYIGCAVGQTALARNFISSNGRRKFEVVVRVDRLVVVLLCATILTSYSFLTLGDSMFGRYAELILFRAYDEDVQTTALHGFAFSLTQSWTWLAVLAIFGTYEQRRWRWLVPACLIMLVIFMVLGVSRRAIFIPLLMCYLVAVLRSSRWKVGWILVWSLPLLLLVAFGKNIFSVIAYGGTAQDVAASYESWINGVLRAATEVGITVVESLGTLQFLEEGPRYGIDHILSVLRLFPEGALDLAIEFPERIVRISTEAFAGSSAQDIPPGLFGQMWLDFRVFGPVIWGAGFGLQMSLVQYYFESVRRTRQAAAVFVLIVFIVALPLNSGSFDFTFSVDIVAVVLTMLWCVRFRPMVDRAYSVAWPNGHSQLQGQR